MTRRTLFAIAGFVVAAAALWWILFVAVPGWRGRTQEATDAAPGPTGPPTGAATSAERKITATLYYVAEDGMSLVPAQREVTFGEPVVAQARAIVEAQLAPVQPPLASAVPPGTKLRALFVTEQGEAFVDLSSEITTNQILVDGKEAETLAGHVDLRQPLTKNLTWIRADNPS
jgi:hypothetical protein